MKIYSTEASIPAIAVTLASGLGLEQPILFTNQFCGTPPTPSSGAEVDTAKKKKKPKLEVAVGTWAVKDVTVTLTRDWGTSQATIVLVCSIAGNERAPMLPDVSDFRGGVYPYLCEEDEIRIYAGYKASVDTLIDASMLDEIPFDFKDLNTGKEVKQDPSKSLCPIFWGFIDVMKYTSTATGVTLTLQCRDRVRVLADTRLVNLQNFSGRRNKNGAAAPGITPSDKENSPDVTLDGFRTDANRTASEADKDATTKSTASGDRVDILMRVAQSASGNPYGETEAEPRCWRAVVPGMVVRGFTYDAENRLKQDFPADDPAAWVRTAICRTVDPELRPRMNAWAEKPPIVKGEATSSLAVFNKVPLEIIDFLAKTEARPTDFFCSHINGDFIFGPRVKDEAGFTDPLRSYRTYFHRTYPKGSACPSVNQMVLKLESTRSTLFNFNNFVIVDSSLTKGSSQSVYDSVRRGYSALPPQLEGRTPPPPCKTQIIQDGGLAAYNNPEYGALIVGLAQAKTWSRDIQGVEMELLGDPTLYPSEAIRVYNTYLHDYQSFTVVDNKANELAYDNFKSTTAVEASKNVGTTQKERLDTSVDNPTSKAIAGALQNPGRVPSNIDDLVLPYYSIRVVEHKFTAQGDKGFRTTIMAVTDV